MEGCASIKAMAFAALRSCLSPSGSARNVVPARFSRVAAGPTTGACLLHVDQKYRTETGDFVAPAGGSVAVVIDASDDPEAPPTGAYTLTARPAAC